MAKKKALPQYVRVSLYFDDPKVFAKISRAADKAGRSRNNWIIRAAARVADEELANGRQGGGRNENGTT